VAAGIAGSLPRSVNQSHAISPETIKWPQVSILNHNVAASVGTGAAPSILEPKQNLCNLFTTHARVIQYTYIVRKDDTPANVKIWFRAAAQKLWPIGLLKKSFHQVRQELNRAD
jgi:hypothetical protein